MQSAIMKAPPCTRELWDYLLLTACYTARKENGIILKRGQVKVSLEEIITDLSWYVGFRKMCYTKDQLKAAMRTLRKALMITSMKTPTGMVITICNYDYYQNPKNYENTNENTNETTNDIPTITPAKHQDSDESQSGEGIEAFPKKYNKETIKYIVDHLNLKTGKSFKSNTRKTKDLINTRLKEGFTLEDFKKVIDTKSSQWLNTKYGTYLRPETLFGNKFEGYLNEKPINGHNLTHGTEYQLFDKNYRHA